MLYKGDQFNNPLLSMTEKSVPPRARTRQPRRFDPQRRNRIVDMALKVIAEVGVARTTHRLIADRAQVSLGSMTYHFKSLDEVIWSAFEKFAVEMQKKFEERLSAAALAGDAFRGIIEQVDRDLQQHQNDALLVLELYVLAIRHPAYRTLVEHWMASTRASLERHIPTHSPEVIDALIEGFFIHRVFTKAAPSREAIRGALETFVQQAAP